MPTKEEIDAAADAATALWQSLNKKGKAKTVAALQKVIDDEAAAAAFSSADVEAKWDNLPEERKLRLGKFLLDEQPLTPAQAAAAFDAATDEKKAIVRERLQGQGQRPL